MGMHFYDWRNITLLIDGVKVTGWWEGDDVLGFKRVADSVTTGVGVDGEMFVSLNADKRVTLTIKLAQTSPMNAQLSTTVAAQDRMATLVPVQALFMDHYRQDKGVTTLGIIKKHADIERGGKIAGQTWEMEFAEGHMLLGNSTFAGLATAAAEALGAL